VALSLALPAAAGAYTVSPASRIVANVTGTHGFGITLWGSGVGAHRRLKVAVWNRDSLVQYRVPAAPAAGNRLVANLGGRGRFDLRFVPVGRVRLHGLGPECEPKKWRSQRGYFVGRGTFRGEGGYTEAHFRRAPALTESWPKFSCHLPKGFASGEPRQVSITAKNGAVHFRATLFHTSARPPGRRVNFRAWSASRSGRISIYREVKVSTNEGAFAFPGGPHLPEVVTVAPPAPFSGTGTVTRSPESTFSWTGDVGVALPGLGPVRLAGPTFEVAVCAYRGCVRQAPEPGPTIPIPSPRRP
jgi:hypothetical protein